MSPPVAHFAQGPIWKKSQNIFSSRVISTSQSSQAGQVNVDFWQWGQTKFFETCGAPCFSIVNLSIGLIVDGFENDGREFRRSDSLGNFFEGLRFKQERNRSVAFQ